MTNPETKKNNPDKDIKRKYEQKLSEARAEYDNVCVDIEDAIATGKAIGGLLSKKNTLSVRIYTYEKQIDDIKRKIKEHKRYG